jgi:hypothetical protein
MLHPKVVVNNMLRLARHPTLIAELGGSLDAENGCGLDGQVNWRRR